MSEQTKLEILKMSMQINGISRFNESLQTTTLQSTTSIEQIVKDYNLLVKSLS